MKSERSRGPSNYRSFSGPKTTSKASTKEILYSLTFSIKVVILVEIGLPSFYIEIFSPSNNKEHQYLYLDCLKEMRDQVLTN